MLRFDTFEVCLSIESRQDNQVTATLVGERIKEGDIGYVRPASGLGLSPIGARTLLWLSVSGLDNNAMWQLGVEIRSDEATDIRYDKRRYSIPFSRLPNSPDLARIRDKTDAYQPYMPIDKDNLGGGHIPFLPGYNPPLDVHGLIYDRLLARFL